MAKIDPRWWSQVAGNDGAYNFGTEQVYTLLTGVLCDETADYLVAFRSEFVVSQASLVAY